MSYVLHNCISDDIVWNINKYLCKPWYNRSMKNGKAWHYIHQELYCNNLWIDEITSNNKSNYVPHCIIRIRQACIYHWIRI